VVAKLPEEGPLPVIEELPSVIVPPPEPEPARAPRPLVQSEDDLEESVDLLPEGAGDEAAAEGDTEVEEDPVLTEGFGPSEPEPEGADAPTIVESAVTEDDPAREVEPRPAESSAGGEPDAALAAEAPVQPLASVEDAEAEDAPQAPEDPGAEPPARHEGEGPPAVHDSAEMREDGAAVEAEAEPQSPPRKRWSLFRRGGDR
jgi:hypothetical protein